MPLTNLPDKRPGTWGQGITASNMKECRRLKPTGVAAGEQMSVTNRGCYTRWITIAACCAATFPQLVAQTPEQLSWGRLRDGASDKSAHTRAVAVRSLGLVPRDTAVEKLALNSLHDPNAEVRAAAASASRCRAVAPGWRSL